MAGDQYNSTRVTTGSAIFFLPRMFLGEDMVPGWGFLQLRLPQSTCVIVVGLSGAVGEAILAPRPILGFVCGGVAALSSLGVLILVLQHVNVMYKFMFLVVFLVGTAPGFGLYYVLDRMFRNQNPPISEQELFAPKVEFPT